MQLTIRAPQQPVFQAAPDLEDHFLSWVIHQPDLRLAYHWIPPEVFTQSSARAVWAQIQGGEYNLMSLWQELPKHQNYLNRIAQVTTFAPDLPGWAKKLVDLHTKREIHRVAVEAINLGQQSKDPAQAIAQIIAEFGAIANLANPESSLASHGEAAQRFLQELTATEHPDRYHWGWADLDRLTGGVVAGQLVTIGARPSMGKSTFALNAAQNMAEAGHPTLFISLEMTLSELEAKVFSRSARVVGSEFQTPERISDITFDRMIDTADKQQKLPLWFDDGLFRGASDIETAILKVANHYGEKPKVVFIDYLQLMSLDAGHDGNMVQAISALTRSLKQLAKKHEVAIVILSQLSRGVEGRNDKRPNMADLRDSGSIEQDSNLVIMLYRDAYYNPSTELGDTTEVIVVKSRSGATGKVELVFDGQFSEFKGRI